MKNILVVRAIGAAKHTAKRLVEHDKREGSSLRRQMFAQEISHSM
jgi:hypothetical protein